MILKRCIIVFTIALTLLSCQSQQKTSSPKCLNLDNKTRVIEFLSLNKTVGSKLWSNWNKYPTPILLIEDSYEFLVGYEKAPQGFKIGCAHNGLGQIFYRPRKFPKKILASFPAFDSRTVIVIGTVKNTGVKSSTDWLSILFHERFHQIQFSQTDYYSKVDSVKPKNSKDASWMLNYPFPYKNKALNLIFADMSLKLYKSIENKDFKSFSLYLKLKSKLKTMITPEDFFYMQFQIWQEGVARYTEIKSLRELKNTNFSANFLNLSDFQKVRQVLNFKINSLEKDIQSLSLKKNKRTSFYTIGYYEALAFDIFEKKWKEKYFNENLLNLKYSKN